MGYYTRHSLEVVRGDESLISELQEYSEDARYALCDDGSSADACTWYGHEKELIEFSKLHPEALLKLSGEGEENCDMWHEYYRNGKVQVCKARIVYDDFDESLLK